MNTLNSENIKKYLLSNEYQFKIFDIPYAKKEKKCIKKFNLATNIEYNNYGDNDLQDLIDFLKIIGNNSEKKINKMYRIIEKILNIVMRGYQAESYWLSIRVTKPINNFDIPRWHCDGNHFTITDERILPSKFATTLIGPGTLLLKTNPLQKNIFRKITEQCLENNTDQLNNEVRLCIDKKKEGTIIIPTKYQSVIFFAGGLRADGCGIHSEPRMNTSRMFLSILPGSKKEISEWRGRTKQKGGSISFYSKYLSYKNEYINLIKFF